MSESNATQLQKLTLLLKLKLKKEKYFGNMERSSSWDSYDKFSRKYTNVIRQIYCIEHSIPYVRKYPSNKIEVTW